MARWRATTASAVFVGTPVHKTLTRHTNRSYGNTNKRTVFVDQVLSPVALVEDYERTVFVFTEPAHQLLEPAPGFHEKRVQIDPVLAQVRHAAAALNQQRVGTKHNSASSHLVQVTCEQKHDVSQLIARTIRK